LIAAFVDETGGNDVVRNKDCNPVSPRLLTLPPMFLLLLLLLLLPPGRLKAPPKYAICTHNNGVFD
jgi:hypothetical protein